MTEHISKIAFSDQLLTNISLVDDQHKFLINMFNRLVDILASQKPADDISNIFEQLLEYTRYHFSTEEDIMGQQAYPGAAKHKAQHAFFIEKVNSLALNATHPNDATTSIATFLAKWIQNHICIADKQLGQFLADENPQPRRKPVQKGEQQSIDKIDLSQTKYDAAIREISIHKLWIAGKAKRSAELDFKDMSELKLDNVDLTSASLIGANLKSTNLRGANFTNANLMGADLELADLTDANLTGANLRGANLHRALLTSALLRGADLCPQSTETTGIEGSATKLTEAKLEKAIFSNAKLVNCDFTGADMAEADLGGADLSGAILLGTDLHGARFAGAIMTGAVIDLAMLDDDAVRAIGAVGGVVEPVRAALTVDEFVDMIGKHEKWIDCDGKDGERLDLDHATIPYIKMSGLRLAGCRMRHCHITGGQWTSVDLCMADFSYSNLEALGLEKALLSGATFRRVNLTGANMSSTKLDALPLAGGQRVWPTNFEGAILKNVNLSNASMDKVIFRGANLEGAIVDGISARNVDYHGAKR